MSSAPKWWRRGGASPLLLNVALQGGGAHGAFTAGVLDTLLAEPRIGFEGLSGSSAGAMNAVVLAQGWMAGGRDGARQALARFWAAIGEQMPPGLVSQGDGDDIGLSPAGRMLATWAGFFSPTQLNPFDLNPLRELLAQQIDFERLRAESPFKLFVGATQANSGKLRIFREHELTLEMLLASACLPKIHRSVEIDGEPYWDGGYSGNPAVFPLFYECSSRDVLLVLLSPLQREGPLHKLEDIEARIVELAFSANFMREMRMFAQARSFSRPTFLTFGRLERRLRAMRFHMIDVSRLASLERTETKLLAHGPYLERLAAQGRERAAMWIEEQLGAVGRRPSIDLQQCFS